MNTLNKTFLPLTLRHLGMLSLGFYALIATPSAWATQTILSVSTCIDGMDNLIISGNTLQWQYISATPVGVPRGDCAQSATIINTSIDGVPVMQNVSWTPTFPSSDPGVLSDLFVSLEPMLPTQGIVATSLMVLAARESLTISQLPTPSNNNTTILTFSDDNVMGAALYSAQITFDYTAMPEPATFSLIGIGLAALGAGKRRKLEK